MKILQLRTDQISWREIDGEILALNLESSSYLQTNSAGGGLWKMLIGGASREHLIDHLVATYEIERERATVDVDAFVADLNERGLLEA